MNLIKHIEEYTPCNEQEQNDKEIILSCIDKFEDVLTRDNEVTHLTSSSFILNKNRDKVLMIHHNIYNSWAWTGGHADGESDLLCVAIKEAKEETGVNSIYPISNDIFSLDVLPVFGHIKKGKYVSAHLHMNVTYLLQGDENEALTVKEDENSDVKWIAIDKIIEHCNEPHMQKVYGKLISKLNDII
ncbi:NUDIX hydrolase [Clostridium sp.]|uniref:NUDIX hydrolase n=1 Tax=Clostridium sp. TaxID=1506 RepID=UPI002FCB7798